MMLSGSTRSTGLRIEDRCRQCGAPVTLDETDRLIRCPYCRVQAYLVAPDVFRYLLPHRTQEGDLLYFPYWRFRGVFYACTASGVEYRFVDASERAIDAPEFPSSLGLRAQTMPLNFATPETAGRFLPPRTAGRAVAEALAQRCRAEFPEPVLHHELVGETLSLVYAPFRVGGRLYDAVTDHPVPGVTAAGLLDRLPAGEQVPADVRFLPALCPHCGWDLEGERDSLVLLCRNCHRALQATPQGLVPTPYGCTPGGSDGALQLPFWRVTAGILGAQSDGRAELARTANVLGALREDWEARQLDLWVPAFKIRPDVFLLLARTLTLARPEVSCEPAEARSRSSRARGLPGGPCHPVNLPLTEALESLKVVLASLCSPPATYLPDLPGISVEARETRLVFVPFADAGSQWVRGERLAVSKSTLGFGLRF